MAAQALAGRPSFCWLRIRPLAGCGAGLWLLATHALAAGYPGFGWLRSKLFAGGGTGFGLRTTADLGMSPPFGIGDGWGLARSSTNRARRRTAPCTRRPQTTPARNMVGLGCNAPRQGERPNWRLFRSSLNLSSGRCPNLAQASLLNSALAWRLALRPPCSDGAAGAGPSRGPLPRRPAVAVREPDKRFDTCWRR